MRLSYLALEDVTDYEDLSAQVTDVQSAYVAADAALATSISTVAANLAATDNDLFDLSADVTALESASVAADAALASSITTLTADLGTTNATVTAQGNAFASFSGAFAEYTIGASVDGVTGAISLKAVKLADGTDATSVVEIESDKFVFKGDLAEFLGDVLITGDLIVDGAFGIRYELGNTTDIYPSQYDGAPNGGFGQMVSNATVEFQPTVTVDYRNTNPIIATVIAKKPSGILGACSFDITLCKAAVWGTWVEIGSATVSWPFDSQIGAVETNLVVLDADTIPSGNYIVAFVRRSGDLRKFAPLSGLAVFAAGELIISLNQTNKV